MIPAFQGRYRLFPLDFLLVDHDLYIIPMAQRQDTSFAFFDHLWEATLTTVLIFNATNFLLLLEGLHLLLFHLEPGLHDYLVFMAQKPKSAISHALCNTIDDDHYQIENNQDSDKTDQGPATYVSRFRIGH